MIKAVLGRFSSRSRSAKPPRMGPMLAPNRIEVGPDSSRGVILYLEDITVSFDGFRALNALTLYIEVGELRCIIGPTGAGKTTMMDATTGKTRPDTGSPLCGHTLAPLALTEPETAQAGIGRKFQKPTVFEHHPVFENLELAMAGDKSVWKWLYARTTAAELEHTEQVLETVRLTERRDARAGLLSHGQKQWLEIGMLLIQEPQLLLVDEPVAGMTPQEVERTAEPLTSLAGRHSVIAVEAHMD